MKYGHLHAQGILLFAAAVSPFTALRVGLVGPGEVLFALMFLLVFISSASWTITRAIAPILLFWGVFVSLTLIYFCVNVLFFGNRGGPILGAVFDFVSYLTIFGVVSLLGQKSVFGKKSASSFFRSVFAAWAVIFIALYIVSFVTPTIGGLPLKYFDHFSPLVDNVHQAAMITAAMPFVMWHLGASSPSRHMKLLCLAVGLLFIKMALDSGATKAMAGVLVGAVAASAAYFFQKFARNWRQDQRLAVLLGAAFVVIALVLLNMEVFSSFAQRFFYDNDVGGGRAGLYSSGLLLAMDSIVFGYGPGPHIVDSVSGGYWDAHNTTLTLLLQGGIVAVGLFYFAAFRVAGTVARSPFLIGALCSISIYLLGGDILRRLPIWVMVVGIVYLAETDARTKVAGRRTALVGPPSRPARLSPRRQLRPQPANSQDPARYDGRTR